MAWKSVSFWFFDKKLSCISNLHTTPSLKIFVSVSFNLNFLCLFHRSPEFEKLLDYSRSHEWKPFDCLQAFYYVFGASYTHLIKTSIFDCRKWTVFIYLPFENLVLFHWLHISMVNFWLRYHFMRSATNNIETHPNTHKKRKNTLNWSDSS